MMDNTLRTLPGSSGKGEGIVRPTRKSWISRPAASTNLCRWLYKPAAFFVRAPDGETEVDPSAVRTPGEANQTS
jgi:hypothetical protein